MTRNALSNAGWLVALCLIFAGTACEDPTCDPDQVLRDNQCFAKPPAGTGGSTTGGIGQGGGGQGGESSGGDVFGRFCTDNSACEAPAETCGLSPGATEGYCTASGCDTAGVVCPAGFKCLNFADACIYE